ncbi:probable serine/threonine-protein kinase iksA [Bactrocera neohumeralis]|uniref:probable serine/threonine-protein kinase iksA n=1 Tax=Bactrocera neohumeralis TaxID=98809 RepID=UPI002165711E|nr:probable serine/threonine-protein kinase iksA [Bactrocera neohumeralis]
MSTALPNPQKTFPRPPSTTGSNADPFASPEVSSPVLVLPRVNTGTQSSNTSDLTVRGGDRGRRNIRVLSGPPQYRAVGGNSVSKKDIDRGSVDYVPQPPAQPTVYYVSPTGSPDPDTYGFPDASVDPSYNYGVEWPHDDPADPPNVHSTISYGKPTTVTEKEQAGVASEESALLQQKSTNKHDAKTRELKVKLGSGTYGGVYLCQHVMEGVPLGTFALKKVPVGDNAEYLQKVLSEVRILEEVKRHPNVVEYNHSWVEEAQLADFGPPVRCLFILMEYATEGALDSYLEGTAHLHQKNILHRDLKPQNLLLTGPPGKPPRVLVSDFGTAALLGEKAYERTGGTGTLEYMAPELMEVLPNCSEERYVNHHTKASDVWSLGMILYYLACDTALPAHLPDGSVALNHIQSRSPFTRPPEMVELIRAMLQRDPRRRPSCNEILSSTVVQTILRSFNSAAASGTNENDNSGYNVITRDIMPCDDRTGSSSPPRTEFLRKQREPSLLSHGSNKNDDTTYANEGKVDKSSIPAFGTGASDNCDRDELCEEDLQSSRVELMSTTVNPSAHNLMEVPLLMQYRSNDAATTASRFVSSKSGGSSRVTSTADAQASPLPHFASSLLLGRRATPSGPDGSARALSPGHLSPTARRPLMVDAEVQTDPVNILD